MNDTKDLIFNELSIESKPERNVYEAGNLISQLLKTIKSGSEEGLIKVRVRDDFFQQKIGKDYTINDWLSNSSIRRIERDLLLGLFRYPYIAVEDREAEENFVNHVFYLAEDSDFVDPAEGLGVAYLYNAISVSLATSDLWDRTSISLKIIPDNESPVFDSVRHVSNPDHIKEHQEWLDKNRIISLKKSVITPSEKEIRLREDHGKDVLMNFSKRLIQSEYVEKIINSLPFNSHDRDFIRSCNENGQVEIVLVRTDRGFGLVVQTTGRNLAETKHIAELLRRQFESAY